MTVKRRLKVDGPISEELWQFIQGQLEPGVKPIDVIRQALREKMAREKGQAK
jgi:hypothetical protein